jgi:hypothetical protein
VVGVVLDEVGGGPLYWPDDTPDWQEEKRITLRASAADHFILIDDNLLPDHFVNLTPILSLTDSGEYKLRIDRDAKPYVAVRSCLIVAFSTVPM